MGKYKFLFSLIGFIAVISCIAPTADSNSGRPTKPNNGIDLSKPDTEASGINSSQISYPEKVWAENPYVRPDSWQSSPYIVFFKQETTRSKRDTKANSNIGGKIYAKKQGDSSYQEIGTWSQNSQGGISVKISQDKHNQGYKVQLYNHNGAWDGKVWFNGRSLAYTTVTAGQPTP